MSTLTKPTLDLEQPTFIEIGVEDRVEVSTAFGRHGRRSRRTIIIYKGQDKQPPICVTIQKEEWFRGTVICYASLPDTLEGSPIEKLSIDNF